MARRASFSINPAWIAVVFLLVAGAIGGGYALLHKLNDPYRTLTPLDVGAYLEDANSLRGNTYKVTATIRNSLTWSPTAGRLFAVEVQTAAGSAVLPLLIPAPLNHVNIQKGQRFVFAIDVDDQGVLKARDLNKV